MFFHCVANNAVISSTIDNISILFRSTIRANSPQNPILNHLIINLCFKLANVGKVAWFSLFWWFDFYSNCNLL